MITSLLLFFILGFSAYEIHLYNDYYTALNLLSFLLLFLINLAAGINIFSKTGIKNFKTTKMFGFYVIVLFLFNSFISLLHFDSYALSRYLLMFPLIILLAINCRYILQRYLLIFIICSLILGIPSILIEFNLLPFWGKIYNRNASIFFDPNYASAFFGLAAILSLSCFVSYKRYFLFILFCILTVFTFSRGGMISLALATLFYFFRNFKFHRYFLIFLILLSLAFIFKDNILSNDLIRVSQGLNDRNLLWMEAINIVFDQQHYFGIGSDFGELLMINDVIYKSTHNFYMDYLLQFGILSFIMLILFNLYILIYGLLTKYKYFPAIIFIMIISNSIAISFGGISILSFTYTLLICNMFTKKTLV